MSEIIDSVGIRKRINEIGFQRLVEILNNLASIYGSNIASTNYALWFRGLTEEIAKLLISGELLQDDAFFDETKADYLFQILGQRLHKVEPEFVPAVRSDKEYRKFVLGLLRAIILGAKLIAFKEGIKIFVENADVVELYKISEDIEKQFKWHIKLDGNEKELGQAWAGLKFWTEIAKPAHTLADVEVSWMEEYKGKLSDSLVGFLYENYYIEEVRKNLDESKKDWYVEEDLSELLLGGAIMELYVNKKPIVMGDGDGVPNWEMVNIVVEIDDVPAVITSVNPFTGLVTLGFLYGGTKLIVKHYWIDRPVYPAVGDTTYLCGDGNEWDDWSVISDEGEFEYIGENVKPKRIIRKENLYKYDYKGYQLKYTTIFDEKTVVSDIYDTIKNKFDRAHVINSLDKTEGMENYGAEDFHTLRSKSTQILRDRVPLVAWTQDVYNEFNEVTFKGSYKFIPELSSLLGSVLATLGGTFILGKGVWEEGDVYMQRLYANLFENTTKEKIQEGDGTVGTILSDRLVKIELS